MFFEPIPPERTPDRRSVRDFPSWAQPPDAEIGVVLALHQVVARSANVVIVLPTVRAFSTGCMFNVEVTARQGDLDPETWWDLRTAPLLSFPVQGRGDRLSNRLLRLGVRYPDGSKATTLERPPLTAKNGPPPGPVLSYTPQSSGGRAGASVHAFGLWLWPVPPAEPIEFAVEWPIAGIGLSTVEVDGVAIRTAASGSPRYWPEGAG
jgi:hypothetical protein